MTTTKSAVTRTQAPVWVLEDQRAGTATQAIGIAERLGVAIQRIPLTWNWKAHVAGLARHGSLMGIADASGDTTAMLALRAGRGPRVVISAGRRSAAVALWLKARFGSRLVHCMQPGLGGLLRSAAFDLLVLPEHDQPAAAPNVMPVLGVPHRVSPKALMDAAATWEDRLDHMPHPRIALLVGGPARGGELAPAVAHGLGRQVARLAAERGGSVMATTSRRTGSEASDALSAGLSRSMHVLYRWGEPGENPYLGMLATCDAVVVTADSVSMLSEACATDGPVLVALPELAGVRQRRLVAQLRLAGQVRMLGNDLSPWPRTPMDEAGRVAAELLERFPL